MSIERVFIIGAGLMGHGIAQVSAAAGKQVTLSDRTADLAEQGKARIGSNLKRQVDKGKLEQHAADELLGRIATVEGTDGAAGHDIVIEAVFEDEAIKRDTWQALTKSADADAILFADQHAAHANVLHDLGPVTAVDGEAGYAPVLEDVDAGRVSWAAI